MIKEREWEAEVGNLIDWYGHARAGSIADNLPYSVSSANKVKIIESIKRIEDKALKKNSIVGYHNDK